MTEFVGAEVFRPYEGLDGFYELLANLEMKVGSQGNWTHESALELTSNDFSQAIVRYRWSWEGLQIEATLRSALKSAQLEASEVSLVGIIRCPLTKSLSTFLDEPLDQIIGQAGLLERTLPVGGNPRLLPNRNLVASFYLLLNENIQGNFPFPYRKGTWLDQKSFHLQSEGNESFDFTWNELNDEVRKERGLHKNSVMFVDQRAPMHEADTFSDCVEAYIDPEYQAIIHNQGAAALSKLLQSQLVLDVVSESFIFSIQQLRSQGPPAWIEIEDQPVLGRLITTLAKSCTVMQDSQEPEDVYVELTKNPTRISEYLQDLFGFRRYSRTLARGE